MIMNKTIKKTINRFLNLLFRIVKNKKKRARITTFISKLLVHKKNSLEYDVQYDMYWQKHGDLYLQIEKHHTYDFSYKKYKDRFYGLFCRKYNVKEGDIVLDIGAGVGGELPFYASLIGKSGFVYAIEASPDSFKKLEALCEKNHYTKNVSPFCLAISDTMGSVWIEETNMYRANQINQSQKGIEVKSLTLDAFVQKHKIQKIDLLKMNIEGAELQVIKGMESSIHLVENFAISCHDFLFEEETNIKETITSFFEKNNFQVEEIHTGNKYMDSWIFGKRI